ncbi:MAG: transcriptional repressor [Actinomycetota bacterium]|nr:transcriptional repressor [Actinomycetota bacterium]
MTKRIGTRNTQQREALLEVLRRAGAFRSAQALHDEMKVGGSRAGLTTVYRNLQVLVNAGTVDVVSSVDGESLYRLCDSERHHHHLLCRTCGSTVELENPEVESWADAAAKQHGFSAVTHTVELYGLCRGCSIAT